MKFRYIPPKSGENHVLFGTKYKKLHKLNDENWTSDHKIDQYNALIIIYEKNLSLKEEEKLVQDKIKNEHLKEQIRESIEKRQQLRELKVGVRQTIKKLFENHHAMQLVYSSKSLNFILTDLDQRIYERRKKLDLLLSERRRMCDLYEHELIDVAQLQDRIRCKDIEELPDDIRSTEILVDINNTENRIKTLKILNAHCKLFINVAMNDALYFNTVLNGLEEDIREQDDFLGRVFEIGAPVIANQRKFSEYFRELYRNNQKDFNDRLSTLMKYRDELKESALRIRGLIRDNYPLHEHRYVRDTSSILDLRTQFEDVQKPIQLVIATTASRGVDHVLDQFEKQLFRCEKIKQEIDHTEAIVETIAQQGVEDAAAVSEENFTKNDIIESEEMQNTTKLIELEGQKQERFQKEINHIAKLTFDMNKTFIHFNELLKNVGDPIISEGTSSYPSSYLALPLLFFDTKEPKHIEHHQLEYDNEMLLNKVLEKANLLMTFCDGGLDDTVKGLSENFYHDATLAKFRHRVGRKQADNFDFNDMNYGGVPGRKSIKMQSKLIEAQHLKMDD